MRDFSGNLIASRTRNDPDRMPRRPSPCRLVLSTCPDARAARRIARSLVGERLAACVNILPIEQSVYRWKGKIESAREKLLVIKIRAADYRRVEKRLRALHPYELPEVVAVPVAAGYARYLAWINNPDSIT
jgi:periplasmic divalent cation tolerance protein